MNLVSYEFVAAQTELPGVNQKVRVCACVYICVCARARVWYGVPAIPSLGALFFKKKANNKSHPPTDQPINQITPHPTTKTKRSRNARTQEGPGVLVLSEFAGSAQSLSGAIRINPWNTEEVGR